MSAADGKEYMMGSVNLHEKGNGSEPSTVCRQITDPWNLMKSIGRMEDRVDPKKSLVVFEGHQIRRVFDEKKQEWFFSVVDVVGALTQQPSFQKAGVYWRVLKHRLKREGSQLVTNCNQLKLRSSDGKEYMTDVADAENLLRLVQSIPSPKAEPLKLWLAKVVYERLKDMADLALSLPLMECSICSTSREIGKMS